MDSVAVRTEAIQLKRNALSTCSEPKSVFTIRPGVDQALQGAHAIESGSTLRIRAEKQRTDPTLVMQVMSFQQSPGTSKEP